MRDVISALVAVCEFASKGRGLLRKHVLSPMQKQFLLAGRQSGEFHVIEVDQLAPPIIRSGGTAMADENDPASSAACYEAFKSLRDYGYIEHVGGNLFRLTRRGFAKARKLT
jgi:hypothetical protein